MIQDIINCLVLLILSFIVLSAPTDFVSTILLLILVFDALFVHNLRKRIIKDCLFGKRIQIFKRKSYSKFKALRIQYKVLGTWQSDGLDISYEQIDRAINIKKKSFFGKFNYQLGYLLGFNEKKWLQEELAKKLEID